MKRVFLLLTIVALLNGQNLVQNGEFETISPDHWAKAVWGSDNINFAYDAKGMDGSNAVAISSKSGANAAWYTTVPVEPMTDYVLSGWIKTRKVKKIDGKGALIVLDFDQQKAKVLTGSNDWTKVDQEFNSGNREQLNVYCLLGGWGEASGKAWFDNISVTPKNPMRVYGPMTVEAVTAEARDIPLLIHKRNSQLLKIIVKCAGKDNPLEFETIKFQLNGAESLLNIYLYYTGNIATFEQKYHFGYSQKPAEEIEFSGKLRLKPGDNYFWLTCELKNNADLLAKVSAQAISATIDGKEQEISQNKIVSQRTGLALRKHDDDGVDTYRIPGITTSNDGTLMAIYDIRRDHSGDLQADIDVGLSRSTDGGKSWTPMQIIMDMGEWGGLSESENGVGDPSILVDRNTGTIWVAAAWAHGMKNERSWFASGKGVKPGETMQLLLTKSDDDGQSWSKLINITEQIKKPEWELCMVGPGSGITLSDGTLIFPAQYQDEHEIPHSTILYSQDHGQTWHFGTGAKPKTTESQVVELNDGSLMLNMRDDRGGARSVAITHDLGKTWTEHETSRKVFPEPVCNAGFIKTAVEISGKKQSVLLFVNPNSTKARHMMTLKASLDEGKTWPPEYQILLDEETGFGYPNLTMVDENTIGILYESSQAHMTFQKIKLAELLKIEE
ncbi:MAG: exo-alpha-sialidase [Candidatus Marinimicrobia bacterium]|nr:exo-alpha-sialidase [Candidatus Neomarinimicrobiota bacterium]